MKKIIYIFHGSDLGEKAMLLSLSLAVKSGARLKALFVPLYDKAGAHQPQQVLAELFEQKCKAASVDCEIHYLKENQTEEIIDETAFADLLVCGYQPYLRTYPTQFLVSSANCPVLLVQQNGIDFSQVIFTYDGSLSSIYAMKQFTYLSAFLELQKVFLVSVIPVNIREMEYDNLVREWVMLHYPAAEVVVLKGEIKNELPNFINNQPRSLVVMGAFGRNALSMFFKESLATSILKNTTSPIFISHL